MAQRPPARRRWWPAGGSAAAVAVVGFVVAIGHGSGGGEGETGGRGAATCSGAVSGSAFDFSCDAALGGNPEGLLFTLSSPSLASLEVTAPGGISCRGRDGRYHCEGPPIPAGRQIVGTFTTAPIEGEEGELEEEGEEGCEGVRITVIAFGSENFDEGTGEESGEEPAPAVIGRTVIDSCGGGEEHRQVALKLGHPARDPKHGTARLPVTVSDGGTIVLSGRTVVHSSVRAARAGTYRLPVRARGRALERLRRRGAVAVRASVSFTVGGAAPLVRHAVIGLRLSRGRR